MSALNLSSLHHETLSNIAFNALPGVDATTLPEKKRGLATVLESETDHAGIKELAFLLNAMELSEVCNNYLKVQHAAGNNPHSKMVLTKRFIESFDGVTIENWFSDCDDRAILEQMCTAMGFECDSSTSIRALQRSATNQVRLYGQEVVLHRLTIDQLRQVADDMQLTGTESTSSKRILIEAIMEGSDITVAPKKRKAPAPRKKAIEKATKPAELTYHYRADTLENWARENGLKVSGSKKELAKRIIAFNEGDTENTMAAPTNRTVKKATVKKATVKKAAKKAAAPKRDVPKRGTKPVVEEEPETSEEAAEEPEVFEEAPEASEESPEVSEEAQDEPEDDEQEVSEQDEEVLPVAGEKAAEVSEAEVSEEASVEEPAKEISPAPVSKRNVKKIDEDESSAEEAAPAKKTTVKKAVAPKKPAKKVAKKVVEEPSEEASEEPAEEPSYDAAAEQAAIDAERELRAPVDAEVSSEELDVEMSQSATAEPENQWPTDITGVTFCVSGKFQRSRKEIQAAIENNGGIFSTALSKKINVLICTPDSKGAKAAKKAKIGIRMEPEEYLTNFY